MKNVMKQTPMCQLRDIRQQTAGNTSFKWDSYAKGVQWWGLSLIHLLTIFPLPTGHSTVQCYRFVTKFGKTTNSPKPRGFATRKTVARWKKVNQTNVIPNCGYDGLFVGFNPFKIFVKLENFPNFRGESNKYLKSPPRWV